MVEIKTAAQEIPKVFRKFIRRLPNNCSFDMKLCVEFSDDEEEEKEKEKSEPVKEKEPVKPKVEEPSSSDPANFSIKKPRSMLCLNEINQIDKQQIDSKQLFPQEFSIYTSQTESLSNETSFGETQTILKNSSNPQNPPPKTDRKYSKTRSLTTMHSKTSLSSEPHNNNNDTYTRKAPSYHDLYSANQRYPPSTTTAIISPKTVYENEHILSDNKNNKKRKEKDRISPLISSAEKSEKSRNFENDGWVLIPAKKVGNDLRIDLKDLFQ